MTTVFLPRKPGDGIGTKDALTGQYVDGTENDNTAILTEYKRLMEIEKTLSRDPKEISVLDAERTLKSRTGGIGSTETRRIEYV